VQAAVTESLTSDAGGVTMLARLAELMFVEVIRRYIEDLPEGAGGWLAAVKDRHIGAALRLIHRRPAEPWTIEGLAREVGLSRSAFAELFAATLDMPVMQYVARWRLQLAARLLKQQGASVSQAAIDVGYESEAAFRRAFKKYVWVPPGAWRKGRVGGAGAELAAT
jgi:AraC-like DNA-binding protein